MLLQNDVYMTTYVVFITSHKTNFPQSWASGHCSLIPQSHLLYGSRTVAVELQNRVIPAVAVEILRWPQGHRTANPYVLQAAGVAVEL